MYHGRSSALVSEKIIHSKTVYLQRALYTHKQETLISVNTFYLGGLHVHKGGGGGKLSKINLQNQCTNILILKCCLGFSLFLLSLDQHTI